MKYWKNTIKDASLILLVLALSVTTSFYVYNKIIEQEFFKNKKIPFSRQRFNTSLNTRIAYYIIAGQNQTLKSDLRGKFWEFQLNEKQNYSLNYISDGPLHVNGVNFTVLPPGSTSISDKKLCIRTPQTWDHFLVHYGNYEWYVRGTHDTFINVTALYEVIEDLESKYDPMNEFVCAYNLHEYSGYFYPQGGTGYIFSNYAVRVFASNKKAFDSICQQCFDDVAIGFFMKNNLHMDLKMWQNDRFICTFPYYYDFIRLNRWDAVNDCPKEGYKLHENLSYLMPSRIRTAAFIHMHKIPMNEVWELLNLVPDDIGITFFNSENPMFCRLA